MAGQGVCGVKGVNSGFTVAEAVVVVVVVAFLLSILVPALAMVKTAAREEVECRANLRQVGIVIRMSLQENDFTMPDFGIYAFKARYPGRSDRYNSHLWTLDGSETAPRIDPTIYNCYWGVAFSRYVKDIDIFGCPAMTQFAEMLANDTLYTYANLAPGVDGKDVIQTAAFGLNGFIGGGLKVNSLRNQAEVIVCTDHVEPRNEQANEASRGDMFCRGADGTNLSHFRATPFRDPDATNLHHIRNEHYRGIFRHNIRSDKDFQTGGRASVLWVDGRVSSIEETYGDNVPNRWYDPRGIWLDITGPPPPLPR